MYIYTLCVCVHICAYARKKKTYTPFSGEEQKWTPEQLARMDS